MVHKYANQECSTTFRYFSEGKLFTVQIDLVNAEGKRERKTEHVWLCAACAGRMRPKIDVAGDRVTVRLALIKDLTPRDAKPLSPRHLN